MTKLLLLVSVFIAVTFAQQNQADELEKVIAQSKACGKELSLDDDTLKSVSSGKNKDNPHYKCYLKCMYEKMGMINAKGEVLTTHEDDRIRKLLLKCQHIVVATCEDSLTLQECSDNAKIL